MEAILGFFQEFINLGAAILLPVVIAILGKFFGMKLGHAIKSGLLVGIGFQGLVLAVNLLITTIQPVMDYYKALGLGSVMDGNLPLASQSNLPLSTITPPMAVPCPPMNFVAEWTTMSAPYSKGRTR